MNDTQQSEIRPKSSQVLLTVGGLLMFVATLHVGGAFVTSTPEQKAAVIKTEEVIQEFFINPYDAITIEAEAYYVYDPYTNTALSAHNENVQLPLASLTKLMTALIAFESVTESETISITPLAIRSEGDSGFLPGDTFIARDLIDFMLMTSSNDAALAVANHVAGSEEAFIELMNIRTRELGLSQTFFTNESGLDQSINTSGSYGSANDMALLMSHILKETPEVLEATTKTDHSIYSLAGNQFIARNTNQDVSSIPAIIGSKTGFTDLAGGNLVIAHDMGIGRPIIIVVLGSSREARFTDVQQLARASIRYIQKGGLAQR